MDFDSLLLFPALFFLSLYSVEGNYNVVESRHDYPKASVTLGYGPVGIYSRECVYPISCEGDSTFTKFPENTSGPLGGAATTPCTFES